MTMPTLTARQAQVLRFIKERIAEGVPPSLRDIAEYCRFASPNSARCHLIALEKKGFITWDPSKSRTIRIVPALPRQSGGMEDFSDLFAAGNVLRPTLPDMYRNRSLWGTYDVLDSSGKMLATIWRVGDA